MISVSCIRSVRRLACAGALVSLLAVAAPLLASPPPRSIDQNSPGMPDAAETADYFGTAVASGDFDGDGYEDLAMGTPMETIDGVSRAGQVTVAYGGPGGVDPAVHDYLAQGSGSVAGIGQVNDNFGYALAAGDFDGDGYDDLAVGVPGDQVDVGGDLIPAGTVRVFYGLSSGLQTAGQQTWRQGLPGLPGVPEQLDQFGMRLVAADFNGDGLDDLAIGVPGEDVGDVGDGGAVNVIYGSSSGLSATAAPLPARIFTQEDLGGTSELFDQFGDALAAGVIDSSHPAADLVIGAPTKNVSGHLDAGAVYVVFGGGTGLQPAGAELWTLSTPGVPGTAAANNRFGRGLAVGDFDANGAADLAVGIPGCELVDGNVVFPGVGALVVLFGAANGGGLTLADAQLVYRRDVSADWSALEEFGMMLTAGNFDGVDGDEIVVGIPYANVGATQWAGEVEVVAVDAGRTLHGWGTFDQNRVLPAAAEDDDRFGWSLAAGDFNGDGRDDLAVGAPMENLDGPPPVADTGEVDVLYDLTLFSDGFDSGDFGAWSVVAQ